MTPKHKPNQLDIYPRRMKFNQKHLDHLLSRNDTSAWSDYERGEGLPSLVNALRLGFL